VSSLENLVRLHRWALDEKRQKLTELEQLLRTMNQDLERLERHLDKESEAAATSLEGTLAYPSFVAAMMERRKNLRNSINEISHSADLAREEVNVAFQEFKKYELAKANDDGREAKKRARREQLQLDEQAMQAHIRKASGER